MESLPLILQCALLLLGIALSRYLWEVSRSVSSVIIGFASFGLLFYLFIVTVSVFSFDCPFQTPPSLVIRFVVGFATPYWRKLQDTLASSKQKKAQQRPPVVPHDLPLSAITVGTGHELMASINTITCIAPTTVQFPWSITPLFIQEIGAEGDRLDAKCITRLLTMSTDDDVVASIMDFIPEVVWHNGIHDVPLKRIYGILMDCFNLSGLHPVVIPKLRDVAYRSAKAFVHIALQRRCIARHEEQKHESWADLCTNHRILSLQDYNSDSDFKAVLYMVDLTLGHQYVFPWDKLQMKTLHREWMSHVLLYYTWHEGAVHDVVMGFVENSMSVDPRSDILITNCLFIIGLSIGIPFHVNDITVRDKRSVFTSVFPEFR